MLTGKTEIILTDVNTGEEKHYEDNNTVTNALNYILKQYGYITDPRMFYRDGTSMNYSGGMRPFYKTLLGGLLLFDRYIDPNGGETIFAPSDTNLVGCGAYGLSGGTSNVVRGTYNSTESEYSSSTKTMKYVYDFSTSQANGTIASVCLTSLNGGLTSYGHKNGASSSGGVYPTFISTSEKSNGYSLHSFGTTTFLIDCDGDYELRYVVNSTTDVSVVKYGTDFKKISIFASNNGKTKLDETHFSVTLSSTSSITMSYDSSENKLYIIDKTSLSNGSSCNINTLNLGDGTSASTTFTNKSGVTVYLVRDCIQNGILYLIEVSSKNVYSAPLDDLTSVTTLGTYSSGYTNGPHIFGHNGITFLESYSGQSYVLKDGLMLKREDRLYDSVQENVYFIPINGTHGLYVYSSNYSNIKLVTHYLATINNLAEPITKTATNTMKIIYTISET